MTQVQLNKIKRFWNPQKAVSQIANIYKFENNYNENYDAWYWYKILLTFCPDSHNILNYLNMYRTFSFLWMLSHSILCGSSSSLPHL